MGHNISDMETNPSDQYASRFKQYTLRLGKLVSHFQSLEFILRTFLVNYESKRFLELVRLFELKEGEFVTHNAFTNWDNLRNCIEKYNSHVKSSEANLEIDETLVVVRDAIAHGRVFSQDPAFATPNKLLKFSMPQDDKVQVEFSAWLTEDWLGI